MKKIIAALALLLLATPAWAATTATSFDDTTTPLLDNSSYFMACHDFAGGSSATDLSDFEIIDGSEITATFTSIALDYLWFLTTDPDIALSFEYDHATDDVLLSFGSSSSASNQFTIGTPVVLDLRDTAGLVDATDDTPADNLLLTTTGLGNNESLHVCARVRLIP